MCLEEQFYRLLSLPCSFIAQTSCGDKDSGVDVIIEMLANENLSNDLKLLSYGGRVVVSLTLQHPAFHQRSSPLHSNLQPCTCCFHGRLLAVEVPLR